MKKLFFFACVLVFANIIAIGQDLQFFGFETLTMPDTGFWNGSDTSVYNGYFGNAQLKFYNNYNPDWDSWTGFAFSNWTNDSTNSFTNQWSTYAGQAKSGDNFGLGYVAVDYSDANYPTIPSVLEFSSPVILNYFFVTNSTYAALTIKNGSAYSNPFSTANHDYFKLLITLLNNTDTIDTVEFYLADYRTNDSVIVKDWKKIEFNQDTVTKVLFDLVTTDVGNYGPNTPLYFCLDDISYKTLQFTNTRQVTKPLTLYPNPATNFIIIQNKFRYYEIFNIAGTKVKYGNENRIDVSNLKSGIYIIKTYTSNGTQTAKFIKN